MRVKTGCGGLADDDVQVAAARAPCRSAGSASRVSAPGGIVTSRRLPSTSTSAGRAVERLVEVDLGDGLGGRSGAAGGRRRPARSRAPAPPRSAVRAEAHPGEDVLERRPAGRRDGRGPAGRRDRLGAAGEERVEEVAETRRASPVVSELVADVAAGPAAPPNPRTGRRPRPAARPRRRPSRRPGRTPPSPCPAGRTSPASPGSDRTALASLTALNRRSASASPVFVSGWCLRASLRKAFLMSAWDAVLGTPEVGVVVLVFHAWSRPAVRRRRPRQCRQPGDCGSPASTRLAGSPAPSTTTGWLVGRREVVRRTRGSGSGSSGVSPLTILGGSATSGFGLRRRAASSTCSIESTRTSLIDLRISSGMSRSPSRSSRQDHDLGARQVGGQDLALQPADGRTRPRRVISPVMATSLRTGMPVSALDDGGGHRDARRRTVLGDAPAGTWMWRVFFSKISREMPSSRACARVHDRPAEPTRASPRRAGR